MSTFQDGGDVGVVQDLVDGLSKSIRDRDLHIFAVLIADVDDTPLGIYNNNLFQSLNGVFQQVTELLLVQARGKICSQLGFHTVSLPFIEHVHLIF